VSAGGGGTVVADEVVAESLDATTVTFNGSSDPSLDLGEPGRVLEVGADGSVGNEFPAYSMTLLTWGG
jgi:hypothetical protein